MKLLYKKILDLELWHDYFLGQRLVSDRLPDVYDISDLLTIAPTPECQRTLQNLRWRFRPTRFGGTLWAEVEPVTTDPFYTKITVDRPEQLTFCLIVRDPQFANFTNLSLTSSDRSLYYFSNRSGNQLENSLFLSQPLPNYQNETAYKVGELVTHNDQTWEAVRDFTTTTDDPVEDDWQSFPLTQYVSQPDRQLLPPMGNFSPSNSMTRYTTWGIVEIFLNSPQVASDFLLLRSENDKTRIQPRTYVIRFKNRSTYWRYRYERPHGFRPDQLQLLNLRYETEKSYFTQRPQGLLQRPNALFKDGKDRLLPAPRVAQIKPESQIDPDTQAETIAIFSDIYL